MNEEMIRAEGLCMSFRSGIEKGYSLKQSFIDCFDREKRAARKKHEVFRVLRGVSFCVRRGEVVGLIGANGAGKSTLLKLVAGVLKPSAGQLAVFGRVCPMIELGAGFDPELTARENIVLNGAVMGYPEALIRRKFDEIVAFSELEAFLDVPIRSFSSGMTARLAFSVATVVEPEILIVDEILSVGDLAFQEKSERKMRQLIDSGTAVLYVSHALDSVCSLCGRAIWLEGGLIREDGEAAAVCEHYRQSLALGTGGAREWVS